MTAGIIIWCDRSLQYGSCPQSITITTTDLAEHPGDPVLTPTVPSPHYPMLTPATARPTRARRAIMPVAPRPHEPGQTARHTLTGCPATTGSAPCLCIGRDQ